VDKFNVINMVIDDDFAVEEYVTVEVTYHKKIYSITFKKADLEVINTWIFENGTSLPADLPDDLIDSIREEVKVRI
jgi:hypothetical protein